MIKIILSDSARGYKELIAYCIAMRKSRGLNINELSKRSGLTVPQIARIEAVAGAESDNIRILPLQFFLKYFSGLGYYPMLTILSAAEVKKYAKEIRE